MRSIDLLLVAALVSAPITQAAAKGAMIVVRDARIRVPPPGAPTAAGYAVITNASRHDDRLIGAESAAAASVEVHAMSMTGGIMRMRPVEGGLAIGSGRTVRLAEGGYHLMFVSPKRPLKSGQTVATTLRFEHAGPVVVSFKVGG